MCKSMVILSVAAAVLLTAPAFAELQNVTVDGSIQIRAGYYRNVFASPTGESIRWPGQLLFKRPIGGVLSGGAPGQTAGLLTPNLVSPYRWDSRGNDMDYVEQRTRLGVHADFTDQVTAYIELDNYHLWGDDFRADWIDGTDFGPVRGSNVEIYQAYVQADQMWGSPLSMRIGRQELAFGSSWLVGANESAPDFTGLSFDGVRATYGLDEFSVDAFYTQLAQDSPRWQDDKVTFAGVYGSWLGLPDHEFDAYWLWLRDPTPLADTNLIFLAEWFEDLFGVDDYNTHNVHTFGLRGAGEFEGFDYEAEVAYQVHDDASQVGFLFKPFVYGDNRANTNNWAAHGELGYTFDMQMQPRVYLGGAYFDGEDNRDINFLQWLNPFYRPEASVSFNRLFSDIQYSEFFGLRNMSNVWLATGGIEAAVLEDLEVELLVTHFRAVEEFRSPAHFRLGRYRVPIAPRLSFWDSSNSTNLGWEAALYATYHYTEDLVFEAGWAHFFTGKGMEEGNFVDRNGLGFVGGSNNKDADYVYIETRLSF